MQTATDKEAERRLLADADFFYWKDDWETTHDDLSGVCEQVLDFDYSGNVTHVGRLKSLPDIYAVNVPVRWSDDGEPDEWEVRVYLTREGAERAFQDAIKCKGAAHG